MAQKAGFGAERYANKQSCFAILSQHEKAKQGIKVALFLGGSLRIIYVNIYTSRVMEKDCMEKYG